MIRVSRSDQKILKKRSWWVHKSSGYLVSKINGKFTAFHRYILNAERDDEVDHINRDRLDNRRSNLRFAPRYINNYNKTLQRNNRSGSHGVHYYVKNKIWMSYIGKNPRIYLGCYKKKSDAIYMYNCVKAFIMGEV